MANDFLLSICIPTFNRSAVLRETLESITAQEAFRNTNEVEIVISDNASTDDTPHVATEFASRFQGKVIYHRQESNIWTANFQLALSLGHGQYLKLHNDTLLVRDGALGPLLDVIRQLSKARPVIFMTNGNRVREGTNLVEHCNNLDEFLQNVSFFSTWMGGFGLWREDLALAAAFRNDVNHLVQTELACQQLAEGRPAVVFFGTYFLSKQDFRGTYNWAEVFGKNYLGILKKYVTSGHLSRASYEQAKREVLLRHILPGYFNTKNSYTKSYFFTNLADYREDEYFYQAISDRLPLLWRLNNSHNQIELGSVSGPHLLSRVWARARGRGVLNVSGPRRGKANLDIGRFVTIGENVRFIVGEVPPDGRNLSHYWSEMQDTRAGSIAIGDDVWIGSATQIMSGVTVGQGAIIEAGSVVTEDVPPYSRVSGNPARVIAWRFEAEVIEKLSAFDFSTLTDQVLDRVGAGLLAPINGDNVDAFLHLLEVARMPESTEVKTAALAPVAIQRVPAVLLLDGKGQPAKVDTSLTALAAGDYCELPVIVLTTQAGELPEWTDSLRYVQTSAEEFADVLEQLRALPDFEWAAVMEAGA